MYCNFKTISFAFVAILNFHFPANTNPRKFNVSFLSIRQQIVFLLKCTDIFPLNKMAAKAAKKSGEIIGRLRTYIPAGKASASPPLGPQLGQVIVS